MAIPTPTQARARYAASVRDDSDHKADARRDLAAANIAAAIERHLADAPPLTREQIDELSWLLRTGARA